MEDFGEANEPDIEFQESPISEGSELLLAAECMLDIQASPLHGMALQVATNNVTSTTARIGRLVTRSENTKKNIFQVVGFFLVLQTFLITVVGQSSILRKDNLWSPLVLSTVVGVGCFIAVWHYGLAIANLRRSIYLEERFLKVAEKARSELRRLGTNYTFPAAARPKSKKRSTYHYFIPYALVLLFLICFTLLVLISEWRILSSAR